MDTNEVDEAEVAKYRLPPCYEYMEQASILQVMTIRLGVMILGPELTRSMAEYFHFKKSSLTILSEEQIRQILKQNKPNQIYTPIPRRLEIQTNAPCLPIDLQIILRQITSDESINFKLTLETIQRYLETKNLNPTVSGPFSQEFNHLYAEYLRLETSTLEFKEQLKFFCQSYVFSPKPSSNSLIPSEKSAFHRIGPKINYN